MITHIKDDASKSLFEAVQHAAGVTISGLATWLGTAVAALWIYTELLKPEGNIAPPLLWLEHHAQAAGWSASWAIDAHTWLTGRPELFWPLIIAAGFTASIRSITMITWTALLLAVSLRPAETVATSFLALTLVACLLGYALDKAAELQSRGSEYPHYASFKLSAARWMVGPPALLALATLFPLFLAYRMAEAYRTPEPLEHPGFDLAFDAKQLYEKPVAEITNRDLTIFMAKAMLLASGDEQREKSNAVWSMRRDENARVRAARLGKGRW